MIKKWNNLPGSVCVELRSLPTIQVMRVDFALWLEDCKVEDCLPELLQYQIEDGDELVIEFCSGGYYDPGVCNGPVEKSYPPEGEDERIIEEIYIFHNSQKIKIDLVFWEKIETLYQGKIDEADTDEQQDQL